MATHVTIEFFSGVDEPDGPSDEAIRAGDRARVFHPDVIEVDTNAAGTVLALRANDGTDYAYPLTHRVKRVRVERT